MSATLVVGLHTMELDVESESVPDVIGYDSCPDSISGSSNPISTDVPAHSNQQSIQIKIMKMNIGIRISRMMQMGVNMEEIKEDIDIENVIHEWCQSILFINREMRHSCIQFNDGQPLSCIDELFYHKSTQIDEQFGEG
jgi:hypothetical protein